MQYPRFFVPKNCRQDDKIILTDSENNHLFSVLRLKKGDRIDVCLNDGNIYECEIEDANKKQSTAHILNIKPAKTRTNKITLFIALTKVERMDWAVQKVTELGIDKIIPFESKFCTAKDKGNKMDRLNRIALAASKQSGRVNLPEIAETISFSQMLDDLQYYPQIVVAYENDKTSAKQILSSLDSTLDTALIIGSEGGFSADEIKELINNGAKVVSLGANILRAETACIALLSAVLYQFDYWKKQN